ncbi:MAG: hypothetical protein ACE5EA_08520 [Nitrospirota bacterium]
MIFKIVMYNILLPSVLSGSVILVVWQMKSRGVAHDRWGVALGLLLGYVAGHIGIMGWPTFPPGDPTTGWFVYIASAAFATVLAESAWRSSRWAVWTVRTLLMGVTCWLILSPFIKYNWGMGETIVRISVIVLIMLVLCKILEDIGRYGSEGMSALLLTLLATVESIVILLSHSVLLAQLQGVITAALGAAVVLTWLLPQVSLVQAGISMVSMLSVAHAISAIFYADMPVNSGAFLVAAPAAALLIWRRGAGWKETLLGFAATLFMLGLAIVVTIRI